MRELLGGLLRRRMRHDPAIMESLDRLKVLLATQLTQMRDRGAPIESLQETEFSCFSQFGDDGIIQYLVSACGIEPEERIFVEFGVGNYRESNTRLLLVKDNWKGLVIEADDRAVEMIRQDDIYWRHDLRALSSFIHRDNIDALIRSGGIEGDIGLLSIDIDGNDLWVWEAITCISPVLVVAEYNSVFGPDRAVSVPYDPAFRRDEAHPSNLYWGCSIKALAHLGSRKGYVLVGSNSAGNNAYLVREDRLGDVAPADASGAHVESRFRESRDEAGNLSFVGGKERLDLIASMPLVDVEQMSTIQASELRQVSS